MSFLVISSDWTSYQSTQEEAAKRAGAPAWNFNSLARALSQLNPGDELNVDEDISIIRLTNREVEFEGQLS